MPRKGNAPPTPCPSEQAYRRHLAHGEEPCEGCRQKHRDYDAAHRPAPTRFLKPECGTHAGYRWHRRHGEEACRPCKDAVAADRRARYGTATGTQPGRELVPCGTPGAYARHLNRGETPCDECRAAHAAHTNVCNKTKRVLDAMARETG